MSNLSKEQKDLILDFYFRCGEQADIDRGRDLIASNPEAAGLYADLEATLTDLDSIKYEPCPENLVDITIERLKHAAGLENKVEPAPLPGTDNININTLLKDELEKVNHKEKSRESTKAVLNNFIKLAGIAAMVLIMIGIGMPVFSNIRMNYYKTACMAGMGNIWNAFTQYSQDYDDRIPHVPMTAGSPWFKVGFQGDENQSNTRNIWLLVNLDYIDAKYFACPGQTNSEPLNYDAASMQNLRDFPSRSNINYSFMLMCDKNAKFINTKKIIVMSDCNPLFEKIPSSKTTYEKNEFDKVLVNERLESLRSSNHNNKGQNVLSSDGSVLFSKERTVDGDDIYTLKGIRVYIGREIPCDGDTFLVP